MCECEEAGALILIRFGISRRQAAKNALSKWHSVHPLYEGCVSGISQDIEVIEGSWPRDKGFALLPFASMSDAVMWNNCIPEIKQPDWLDGPDMLLMPMKDIPPINKRFIQILDMSFAPGKLQLYKDKFADRTREILRNFGASESIVSCSRPKSLKGLWNPEYMVINFWPDKCAFDKAYYSDEYKQLKEERQCMSTTSAAVFQLESLFPNKN